jgi:hypothetical protein
VPGISELFGSEWAEERGAIEQEVAQDLSNPWCRLFQRVDEDIFLTIGRGVSLDPPPCVASVPFPRRLTVLSSLTDQAQMIVWQYAFNPLGRYSLLDKHVPGFPTFLSHTRAF